jgi:hypothetical protein
MASSAALFHRAVEASLGGHQSGWLYEAGGSAQGVGAILLVLSLFLMAAAFAGLRRDHRGAETTAKRAFGLALGWMGLGYLFLGLVPVVYLMMLPFREPPLHLPRALVVVAAASAMAFLAAVSIPALAMGRGLGPWLTSAGAALGAVGTLGQLALGLSNPRGIFGAYDPRNPPSLLMFGGFPLANWNLPFGSVVSLGAFLLWLAYRFVPQSPMET